MSNHGARRRLAAGSIGNFIENYDFSVFGFSVPILAMHFFPGNDRTASILSAFAAYGAAFLARPIGGLIFGYIADRVGRIKVLGATVWLMAGATALIGLMPTYAELGIGAPIILVLLRIAQGVALGGETSSSASYVIESAAEGGRGRWVGGSYAFAYIATAIVALLFTLQSLVGKEAYIAWVWRVPFVVGGLLGIVGYLIRRGLSETEEFKEAFREASLQRTVSDTVTSGFRSMAYVVILMPALAIGAYLLMGFMYTFLVTQVGLSPLEALLANAAGIAANAITLPLAGALSDRFGRRPVMSIGAAWIALTAYPALWLASSGGWVGALVGQVAFGVGVGLYGASSMTTMLEIFPTAYRATRHAISYQLSAAVFGGTTPFIATWLIRHFASPLAPAFYVALAGLGCLMATRFVPETRNVKLRSSEGGSSQEADLAQEYQNGHLNIRRID